MGRKAGLSGPRRLALRRLVAGLSRPATLQDCVSFLRVPTEAVVPVAAVAAAPATAEVSPAGWPSAEAARQLLRDHSSQWDAAVVFEKLAKLAAEDAARAATSFQDWMGGDFLHYKKGTGKLPDPLAETVGVRTYADLGWLVKAHQGKFPSVHVSQAPPVVAAAPANASTANASTAAAATDAAGTAPGATLRTKGAAGAAKAAAALAFSAAAAANLMAHGNEEVWGAAVATCNYCKRVLHRGVGVAALLAGEVAVSGPFELPRFGRKTYADYGDASRTVTVVRGDGETVLRPAFVPMRFGINPITRQVSSGDAVGRSGEVGAGDGVHAKRATVDRRGTVP